MKIRFYIEKRNSEDGHPLMSDRPIFMTVAFHGKRLLISSGKKIDAHWWDASRQRVRDEHPDSGLLNAWFESMRQTAMLAWSGISNSGKPDVASFREAYKMLNPKYSSGFFDVFFLFMEEGSAKWSRTTYSKVRTTYNHLKEYEKWKGMELTFRAMDETFLHSFKKFYSEKGNGDVTTLKAVNTIVWFLNWATDNRFNIYKEYKNFYKKLDVISDRGTRRTEVFLDWEELMLLCNYSFAEPRKERARDLFCFMCFTGVRYSEITNFRKEHVLEDRIIVKGKTPKSRIIPLNKYSADILKRYENRYYRNNTALPVMSLVTLNKYLIIIAREVGIDVEAKPGLISAGTAPMTFIANALILDIPPEIISTYTGVNSDRRIKILKQQMAKREMEKFDRK